MINRFTTVMDTTKFEDNLSMYQNNDKMLIRYIESMNAKKKLTDSEIAKWLHDYEGTLVAQQWINLFRSFPIYIEIFVGLEPPGFMKPKTLLQAIYQGIQHLKTMGQDLALGFIRFSDMQEFLVNRWGFTHLPLNNNNQQRSFEFPRGIITDGKDGYKFGITRLSIIENNPREVKR